MAHFRDIKTLRKFTSVHASIHNHFNLERHPIPRATFKEHRSAASAEWRVLAAYRPPNLGLRRLVRICLTTPS